MGATVLIIVFENYVGSKKILEMTDVVLHAEFFYPFTARRLRPLRWEMNCVCYLLDRAS